MPHIDQLPALTKLAEEFLTALRAGAQAIASGDGEHSSRVVTAISDKASKFATAAMVSPDLARAVEASPGLAALSLASPELSKLVSGSPSLAELAVVSPNLAQIATKFPEVAQLAKASPNLAAEFEAGLERLKLDN